MKQFLRTFAAVLVLGIGANAAVAQQHDDYVFVLGTYLEPDVFLNLDEGEGVHLGVGWMLNDNFNFEPYFQRTRSDGVIRHTQSVIGGDLQLLFNRNGGFSPYVFAGAGYAKVESSLLGSDPSGVLNGGAGFRANLFGSQRVALRGEYRYRNYDSYGINFDDNLYSLGIQIAMGDVAPKFVDSDGDGIADGLDRCPNTPAGTLVDSNGCERDSDGDGVADGADRCPATPAGTRVDANGCPRDSDGDGVADDMDKCPNTVAGARVDASGCEMDTDKDSVVDRLDKCPNTRAGAQVDINGCEIREEINLQGVKFESNSDRLLPGAESVLNDAAATLQKNPEIRVEVAGHTDSDGTAEYNESLSSRRAATVRDYLIARGVSADRMTSRGYGESEPVADNNTALGKAENRRVVLRITAR